MEHSHCTAALVSYQDSDLAYPGLFLMQVRWHIMIRCKHSSRTSFTRLPAIWQIISTEHILVIMLPAPRRRVQTLYLHFPLPGEHERHVRSENQKGVEKTCITGLSTERSNAGMRFHIYVSLPMLPVHIPCF